MGPKKARLGRKRPHSPVPDTPVPNTDATPSPVELRTPGGRVQFLRPLSIKRCGGVFGAVKADVSSPPTLDEQQEDRARDLTRENEPDHEARIDWYIEVAVEKLKSVLRRANEDKLSRADLWELLTFGQHMYAGMKQQYGIDLNTALVERTVQNTAKGLTPLGQRDEFPWDIPAPRRCSACSRVIVEDLDPLSPRRPWNRPPMTDAEVDELNRAVKALGADTCGFQWSPLPPRGPVP